VTTRKKSKPKKLTQDEATREVYQLFCRGLTHDQIAEHAKLQKWGLRESALDDVIERATDRLVKTAEALNLDTQLGKALERLENLYQDAAAGEMNCPKCSAPIDRAKDPKTALAVQKEINSLLRLADRARHKRKTSGADEAKSEPRRGFTIAA
jgi:hypothetical protein